VVTAWLTIAAAVSNDAESLRRVTVGAMRAGGTPLAGGPACDGRARELKLVYRAAVGPKDTAGSADRAGLDDQATAPGWRGPQREVGEGDDKERSYCAIPSELESEELIYRPCVAGQALQPLARCGSGLSSPRGRQLWGAARRRPHTDDKYVIRLY
jgi:hypothetical protein